MDFFTVPTVTFQILYVFAMLPHERRQVAHFGVTALATAAWEAHQLQETFPFDTAPRNLIATVEDPYLFHFLSGNCDSLQKLFQERNFANHK